MPATLPKELEILRRKFSKVRLTGGDLIRLCDACNITITITSRVRRGFYYCADGKHFITLSSRLSATMRAFVGWHEFAHFLENFYERRTTAAFHGVQPDCKSERLADIFAMICCRPDEITITGGQDFIQMLMQGDYGEEDQGRSNSHQRW